MANTSSAPSARLLAVRKSYGAVNALDGVDLDVRPGELLALLGPNGAGKSTAVGLMLGLTEPDAGEVQLFGQSPHSLDARRRVGVMLQSAGMPDTLTIRELLAQTRAYYPHPLDADACAKTAGIADLLKRRYGKLSEGQKRRVQFALAIAGRPRLLFLDEPTVGLDMESRQALWSTVRALVADGCSVLLTTHYLEEAEELCRRVAIMDSAEIVALDTPAGLIATLDADARVSYSDPSGDHIVYSRDAQSTVLELLDQARDAGATVSGLSVRGADLEDVFLHLTGREYRE